MQAEEYIVERVDNQIAWYSRKSALNKKYYMWTNGLIIFFGAMIPFIAGADGSQVVGKTGMQASFIVALLGVFTATFTGLSALMKFQEKWTIYRTTAEALIREKLLYTTATAPYHRGTTAYNLFVTNIESILSTENSSWSQMMNNSEAEKTE